jgi:tetratricopeptide (TPR) repeat protein
MTPAHVDALTKATLAHGLIQLAVHFPDALTPLALTIPEALERALALAEEAIAGAPDLPDGYVALGRLLLCHDDAEAVRDAIEVLSHALELDPEHDGAEVALATALRERGDKAHALEHVERVLKRGSGQAQVVVLRALLHLDLGRVDEARRDMERALRLAPQAGLVQLDAARVHAAAGDSAGAVALEERAQALLGTAFAVAKKALAR